MADRMYRTQILLEPAQHQALGQIARDEGRSVSDVVREMVRHVLAQRQQQEDVELRRDLEALDRIRQHREEILASRGGQPLDFDPVEAINQAREEQDARNWSLSFEGRD
jgi:Arc/MetJ-type ribon-helix-helix transcriptional regulator